MWAVFTTDTSGGRRRRDRSRSLETPNRRVERILRTHRCHVIASGAACRNVGLPRPIALAPRPSEGDPDRSLPAVRSQGIDHAPQTAASKRLDPQDPGPTSLGAPAWQQTPNQRLNLGASTVPPCRAGTRSWIYLRPAGFAPSQDQWPTPTDFCRCISRASEVSNWFHPAFGDPPVRRPALPSLICGQ